jgi:hypothetical protein
MLSKENLDNFRQLIMRTVGQGVQALRDRISQDKAASGDPGELPLEVRYVQLESDILNVANAELQVLETEGVLAKLNGSNRVNSSRTSDGLQDQLYEHAVKAASEPKTNISFPSRYSVRSWDQIQISFLSEHTIQVSGSGPMEPLNYAEFGCQDRRTKRCNVVWSVFCQLAQENGIINRPKKPGDWRIVEKAMQRLRRILRHRFEISDDPVPYIKNVGYKARFKISCSRSFDT